MVFEIENRQKSKTVAWEHPEPRLSHATPRIRPQWPGTPPVAACPPPGGPGAPGSSAALPLQIKQRAAHQNTPQPHVIDMDPFAASRKSSFFFGVYQNIRISTPFDGEASLVHAHIQPKNTPKKQ